MSRSTISSTSIWICAAASDLFFVMSSRPSGATRALGAAVSDANGDGVADTSGGVIGGELVCFRITAKRNTILAPAATARRFKATVRLTGDGVGAFTSREVSFVVPGEGCEPPPIFL